ncbi:MAG: porin [Planctomycetota bacterium]
MSHTKATVLLAGLTMGLSGAALAQSTMDEARALASERRGDAYRATLAQGAQTGPEFYGLLQFQYNWVILGDGGMGGEDFANGFQNNRTQLGARGTVADGWEYNILGDFSNSSPESGTAAGVFNLLDYYVTIPVPGFNDKAKLTIGQFKLPFLYEENVAAQNQLLGERSPANEFFNQGRSEGILLTYAGEEDDAYRFQAAFADGFRTGATPIGSPIEADFQVGGRFDYKFYGSWEQFEDFTADPSTPETALRIGGAIYYQEGGDTSSGLGATTFDNDILGVTGDIQWEYNQWSAFGAFQLQDSDGMMSLGGTDVGFVAQGGYRHDENHEGFARFSIIIADSMTPGTTMDADDLPEFAFGYNYYVFGDQSAKFTADIVFIFDTVSTSLLPAGQSNISLFPDIDDPQVALRSQFQVTF